MNIFKIVIIISFLVSCSSLPPKPVCPLIDLEDKDKTIRDLLDCNENLNIYIDYFYNG